MQEIANNRSRTHWRTSGFGLIEVILSIAVLAVLVGMFGQAMVASHQSSTYLDQRESCSTTSESAAATVKNFDNSLIVRNWMPTNSHPYLSTATLGDPFCSSADRTPVCDTLPHVVPNPAGSALDRYFNSQNIRGGAAWAQSLFNSRKPEICTGLGITLTRDQLRALLPSQMDIPQWVVKANLSINELGPGAVACPTTALSTATTNSPEYFQVRVSLWYQRAQNSAPEQCHSEVAVRYPNDNTPPTFAAQVTNGIGQVIPQVPGVPRCSCMRTFADAVATGCPEHSTIKMNLSANEPGALLLCRKRGPAAQLETNFSSCGDLNIGNQTPAVFIPDLRVQPTFNHPTQTEISLQGVPDLGDDPVRVELQAVDVGANKSAVFELHFRQKLPQCPSSDTYCPSATGTGTGVQLRPTDDCNNGVCPAGTRARQGCADPTTVCLGRPINDDCGNPTCPPGSSTVPPCPTPTPGPTATPAACMCGNGTCDAGETYCSCPSDCPTKPAGCQDTGTIKHINTCDGTFDWRGTDHGGEPCCCANSCYLAGGAAGCGYGGPPGCGVSNVNSFTETGMQCGAPSGCPAANDLRGNSPSAWQVHFCVPPTDACRVP